ncbi:unnamed protein product [Ilex paraguariensis]|uniref:Uncharacterized protein n=1 Tax=Ilex paraguariensis TaxID=185542 RepID=A0ABC8SA31_9AQUA
MKNTQARSERPDQRTPKPGVEDQTSEHPGHESKTRPTKKEKRAGESLGGEKKKLLLYAPHNLDIGSTPRSRRRFQSNTKFVACQPCSYAMYSVFCFDLGDKLPLGAPALMMSPQGVNVGAVKPELVQKRDEKYKIPTDDLRMSRISIEVPELIHPNADYWKETGKGFAIDIERTEIIS